jgi:hypothetical protein
MVGDRRRWNQYVKYLQFWHFCAVDHCHVEGQAATSEGELFATVPIASPVFHNTLMALPLAVLGLSLRCLSLKVQRDLFKLSITNSCSPTSNGTGWYLDIPLHKLVLLRRLMSTGGTFSAVRIGTLFHQHGHTRVTLRDVYEKNS